MRLTQRWNRRWFLGSLAEVSGTLLVAACQAPATAAPTTASKPAGAGSAASGAPSGAGRTTATFWFNQSNGLDKFKLIVDHFNQSQRMYKLNWVLVPGNEQSTKLSTAIAGGDPPDAARVGGPTANALFIDSRNAAALNDWDPKISTYDWVPAIRDAVTRQNKMYALPVNSGDTSLVYNQDLYEKSGLDPAKPPATLDELVEQGLKIAKPADQTWGYLFPTAPNSQTGDYFHAVLYGYGGDDISLDGTKVVLNSPEAVAAFTFFANITQKNKILPVQQFTETTMTQAFLVGKVGAMTIYASQVGTAEKAKFKVAAAPQPHATRNQVPIGFGTILILAKGKNKDGGWAFAKFVGLDPTNNVTWCTGFGQLPARVSYRETAGWKAFTAKHPMIPVFATSQSVAKVEYHGPGANEIYTQIGQALEAVVFGQKAPKPAANDLTKAAQVILDRERAKGG